MINDQPNGLMYRRCHPVGAGQVIIEELWDLDAPGCPMIRSPWHAQQPGRYRVRRITIDDQEYQARKPLLFERPQASGQ